MSPIQLGQVTNADIYFEGNRMIGRIRDFNIGEIGYRMVTHEALGMIGVLDLPSRATEALKATINLEYPAPELDTRLRNPVRACQFFLHGYLDIFGPDGLDDAQSTKLISAIKCLPAKKGEQAHKLGDAGQTTYEVSVISLIQKMANSSTPIFEYDLFNGIHRVLGKDVWPQ